MEDSIIRIHVERPRPAYKVAATRWKSWAMGLIGLCLLLVALIGWLIHGNAALQERNNQLLKGLSDKDNGVTIIMPERKK